MTLWILDLTDLGRPSVTFLTLPVRTYRTKSTKLQIASAMASAATAYASDLEMPLSTENIFTTSSRPRPSRKYVAKTAAVNPIPTAASCRLVLPRYVSIDKRKMMVVKAQGFTPSSRPATATALALNC